MFSEQCRRVVSELLSTEQTLASNLRTAVDIIIDPVLVCVNQKRLAPPDPSIFDLFDRLRVVMTKSVAFADRLNRYVSDPEGTSLCETFGSLPDLLPGYFLFIHSFTRHVSALRQERKSNAPLDAFCASREQQLGDSLQSFLIQPIQRPPRYRLLLQELIRALEPGAERQFFEEVHRQVCRAIARVDDEIEEYDELLLKTELDSKILEFDILAEPRRMFFGGPATKFSRKFTQERYIVVFSDLLLVAEPAALRLSRNLKVNKLYKSGEYNILPVEDRQPFLHAVDVRQQTKSFRVNMPKAEDKKAILEAFEKMKQNAGIGQGELEMKGFAPVWIPDDQAPLCMNCGDKFGLLLRRHHCRYCGDCVCRKCFKAKVVCPGLGTQQQTVCLKCVRAIGMTGMIAVQADEH
jgi:hypothetical protein